MKKCLGLVALVAAIGSVFISCSQLDESNSCKYEISSKVSQLKNAGLFDSFLYSERALSTDEETQGLVRFITDTDTILDEISESDNGAEQLEVMDVILNGGSVNEFSTAFAKLDPENAANFDAFMQENMDIAINSDARSAATSSSTCFNYLIDAKTNRGLYSADLGWDTIAWYTGFCASTIAGFYMMSYGGFWIKIAGVAAAVAGTASMVYQIKLWADCSDVVNFAKALINKDVATATAILNTESGCKILLISTETIGTVAACYFTPTGKLIVKTVVNYYNALIDKILSALPQGVNYVINGIAIKPIELR